MSQVDLAKLKRIQGAVASTLAHVPEKSAHGLSPTYNSLRNEVLKAIPAGLREEFELLAPQIDTTPAMGPERVIEAARAGAEAYARLGAVHGWLGAIIKEGE